MKIENKDPLELQNTSTRARARTCIYAVFRLLDMTVSVRVYQDILRAYPQSSTYWQSREMYQAFPKTTQLFHASDRTGRYFVSNYSLRFMFCCIYDGAYAFTAFAFIVCHISVLRVLQRV